MPLNPTIKILLLLSVLFCIWFHCTTPSKPDFIDPYTVIFTAFTDVSVKDTLKDGDQFFLGDTINLKVATTYPALVKSVSAKIKDSLGAILFEQTSELNSNDSLYHFSQYIVNHAGKNSIYISAICEGATIDTGFVVSITGRKPYLLQDLNIITEAIEEESCTLTVVAGGTAPLAFKWYRNDAPITNPNTDPHVLVIDSIVQAHKGRYYCEISNDWGTTSSGTTELNVYAPNTPPAPKELRITARNNAWIMLGWQPVSSAISYRVYRDTIPYSTTTKLADANNESYLDETTEVFYYWVTAFDGLNESPRSNCVWSKDTIQNNDPNIQGPSWKNDSIGIYLKEGESYSLSLPDTCYNPDTINPLNFKVFSSTPQGLLADSTYVFTAANRDSGIYTDFIVAGNGSNKTDTMKIVITVDTTLHTMDVRPESNGSVSKTPDLPVYRWGDTVIVTPIPDSGYIFEKWTGAVAPSDTMNDPLLVIVDQNKVIVGKFLEGNAIIISPPADLNAEIKKAIDTHPTNVQLIPLMGIYPTGTVKGEVLGKLRIIIRNNNQKDNFN